MFIRAYLRASTEEQDASRAQASLDKFASEHNKVIASVYLELSLIHISEPTRPY